MGEPRRIQTADAIYLATNRTIDGQPFMAPSERINTIITNNLAWAAAKRKVKLFAYNFLPDCYFMLVSAPLLNLDRFMGDFQGLTALQINAERNRTGRFFAGRYDSPRLLDNDAVIEELGRILSVHAAREEHTDSNGLPGVSSWSLHKTGEALVGERESREEFRNIKRATPGISDDEARRLATTVHKVELAKFDFWSDMTHMDYHRKVLEQARVHLSRADLSLVCGAESEPYVPESRARPVRRLPQCITTKPALRRGFRKRVKELNFKYETASVALRRGRCNPTFPHGMIPPHKPWAVGSPCAPRHVAREGDANDDGLSRAA